MNASRALRVFSLPMLTLLLGWAGCGTTPDSVEWRVQPQHNYYARSQGEVFDALVAVLEQQDYEVTRQARAEGEVEAQSRLLESRVRGAARQYFVTAKVRALAPAETAVQMLVHEAMEGDFKVGATKKALADHGRYRSIFEALEATLGDGSWLPSMGPNT